MILVNYLEQAPNIVQSLQFLIISQWNRILSPTSYRLRLSSCLRYRSYMSIWAFHSLPSTHQTVFVQVQLCQRHVLWNLHCQARRACNETDSAQHISHVPVMGFLLGWLYQWVPDIYFSFDDPGVDIFVLKFLLGVLFASVGLVSVWFG